MRLNEFGSIFIICTILLAGGIAITAHYLGKPVIEKEAEKVMENEIEDLLNE